MTRNQALFRCAPFDLQATSIRRRSRQFRGLLPIHISAEVKCKLTESAIDRLLLLNARSGGVMRKENVMPIDCEYDAIEKVRHSYRVTFSFVAKCPTENSQT